MNVKEAADAAKKAAEEQRAAEREAAAERKRVEAQKLAEDRAAAQQAEALEKAVAKEAADALKAQKAKENSDAREKLKKENLEKKAAAARKAAEERAASTREARRNAMVLSASSRLNRLGGTRGSAVSAMMGFTGAASKAIPVLGLLVGSMTAMYNAGAAAHRRNLQVAQSLRAMGQASTVAGDATVEQANRMRDTSEQLKVMGDTISQSFINFFSSIRGAIDSGMSIPLRVVPTLHNEHLLPELRGMGPSRFTQQAERQQQTGGLFEHQNHVRQNYLRRQPIGNYYGSPFVAKHLDGYIMALRDYGGFDVVNVSKKFYDACVEEFGKGDINA